MKRRFFSKGLCGFSIIALITVLIFVTNDITYVNAYGYNSNVLSNPTPSSSSGWSLTNCEYDDGEFNSLSDSNPMYVTQNFYFSERDIYRINKGEIKIDASAYYWSQCAAYATAYVKAICYNSASVSTGTGEKSIND